MICRPCKSVQNEWFLVAKNAWEELLPVVDVVELLLELSDFNKSFLPIIAFIDVFSAFPDFPIRLGYFKWCPQILIVLLVEFFK